MQIGHHVRNGIGRDGDGLEFRRLIVPIGVQQRVRCGHLVRPLDQRRAAEVGENSGEETQIGDPAEHHVLPVHVADAVPGRDCGQMRRPGCRDVPLLHRKPRGPIQSDFAGAPRLSRDPFDDVVAILGIDAAPSVDIALRFARAPRIGVDHGVAVADPVAGIGTFRLGEAGDVFGTHARLDVQLGNGFAVGAPGHDGGHLAAAHGTQDVRVNRDAVAQRDRHIAIEADVARQGLRGRWEDRSPFEDFGLSSERVRRRQALGGSEHSAPTRGIRAGTMRCRRRSGGEQHAGNERSADDGSATQKHAAPGARLRRWLITLVREILVSARSARKLRST